MAITQGTLLLIVSRDQAVLPVPEELWRAEGIATIVDRRHADRRQHENPRIATQLDRGNYTVTCGGLPTFRQNLRQKDGRIRTDARRPSSTVPAVSACSRGGLRLACPRSLRVGEARTG